VVKKILPLVFIIIIWLIFSKPFFLDNKIPFPSTLLVNNYSLWSSYQNFWGPVKNPSTPDVIDQIMPWKKLTIDAWKEGSIPLWNPYSFSGTPHLANYQSGVFSITNIFYFIFNFNYAWSLGVLIQPLLSGIFMYFYIRSLKLSIFAAIISSLSFMFCGFITVWMSYATLSLAISFLPLALFSIEKFYSRNKMRFLIILAISIALSLFSGHFQVSLYFLITVFLYLLFKFYEEKDKPQFLKTLIFAILGLFISFPQILPSIEFYKEAVRSTIFQKVEPLSFRFLPTIFSPDFYGNPVTRNNFFGNYIEWAMFSGTIPFLLALYSLSAKSKKIIFFLILGIVSLIFSLNTPILDLLINLKIPVLSTSAVGRLLVLFSFSITVLAAFGLDQLVLDIKEKNKKKIIYFFVFFLLIFLSLWILVVTKQVGDGYLISLKNFILPTIMFIVFIVGIATVLIKQKLIKIFLILIIILVAFDMLRFASKWQAFDPADLIFPRTPIIQKLTNLGSIDRIYGPFGAEGSVYFKIPITEGYDPLYINRYGEFITSLGDGKIKQGPRSGIKISTNDKYFQKIIDFLGIRYILQKRLDKGEVWDFPFSKFEDNKFNLIYREKDFFIYENKEVFPKAFLVGNYEVIKNDQKIINKILSQGFDLRKSAVLEKEINVDKSSKISGSAEIIKYTPNKLIIDTDSDREAILVISDNFYPGWHAKMNGKDTEVLRTNYTFRGVVVLEGKNRVEMYYYPESFKWGIVIALISIVGIGIISAKWYTTKKKKGGIICQKHH